jgi:hypothetical protein
MSGRDHRVIDGVAVKPAGWQVKAPPPSTAAST